MYENALTEIDAATDKRIIYRERTSDEPGGCLAFVLATFFTFVFGRLFLTSLRVDQPRMDYVLLLGLVTLWPLIMLVGQIARLKCRIVVFDFDEHTFQSFWGLVVPLVPGKRHAMSDFDRLYVSGSEMWALTPDDERVYIGHENPLVVRKFAQDVCTAAGWELIHLGN